MSGNQIPAEDRTMAAVAHGAAALLGFIPPLVVWLMNKDKAGKEALNDQAKESLNFQITMLIPYIIAGFLPLFVTGLVWIVCAVFCILAALAANKGQLYRYPFALRLIK